MKLLHTSDWHLGAMDSERYLIDDQNHFIDEICGIIESEKIDAVMIAGDVYDRSVASAEAIKLYDKAMTIVCKELRVPVIVIAGNHDGAERLESCSDLLAAGGLYVCGSIEKEVRKVSFDDTDIYMMPWITEEKVKSIYPEFKDQITSIEDAYKVVAKKMTEDFNPAKKHILIAHAFITDSETSTSDRAAVIGSATQVSAKVFDAFDYVALGHLHKPQDVNDSIRYSGTPMVYSFGKEEEQEKSVTVIDTDSMQRNIIPLHPLHKRTTLIGTLDELLNPKYDEETIQGFVKLKVTDKAVGLSNLTQLREVYPNLFECESKGFEAENSTIKLTVEEYEKMHTDPVKVFESFCREICDIEPDERLKGLFDSAVMKAEEEKL